MPPGNCAYLESLRTTNARADAERAVSRGEKHLLGVYGFSLDVPGAAETYQLGAGSKTVSPIDCTSDSPVSPRHDRLIRAAIAYATLYNRRVLELAPDPPPSTPTGRPTRPPSPSG